MIFHSLTVYICVLVSVFNVISALPEGWKGCAMSSPDYEECLKEQIFNAMHFLKNGSKEMSVIPLDPLVFDRLVIDHGSGPISGTLTMTDVKFEGLSQGEIISIKNDWQKMFVEFYTPHTRISGHYFGKGNIMLLPINGDGEFFYDWEENIATLDAIITHIFKDGKKYFQVKNMTLTLSPKKVTMYFGNLFNGKKEMGDHMNKFLNENWRVIIEDLMPAITESLEIGYTEYINTIMCQIPADEIYVE